MSYIRNQKEELTGYQEIRPWSPAIDLQCDFVMVYGIDETMPERIAKFKEKGYVVHLMTGCAWGEYQAYLNGEWDGRTHWDESQTDRDGNPILHGKDTPYMVPTIAFSDYLTQNLKIAVDAGVEAIHLEEPEFWDAGGYSPAFQREYRLYYHEEWQPPHTSVDARYKCSRLKAYLYARALGRISSALKEYAMAVHGRVLRFYVPTHSLLNYTQWKILSPEAELIDIPSVDGYIAQIWTGTSRGANVYEGVVRERTFETAYLEYGVMQELVKGTGRAMWFLHDPIEDFPEYTWDDYRRNYLKTAVASLLHPHIHTYEICPWPDRVWNGVYPRKAGMAGGMVPTTDMEGAKPIPPLYAALLSSMVQLFGDMDQKEFSFEGFTAHVGILMSDSSLYQRNYPDNAVPLPTEEHGAPRDGLDSLSHRIYALSGRMHDGEDVREESRTLMREIGGDKALWNAFVMTGTFPGFYGMAMPLLKYGLPVHPVQLDNVRRFPGYLDDSSYLLLSYEWMKPESPDVNSALASWVRAGGTLMVLGDGSDPYHQVRAWWNTGKARYQNPAEHLFELLDLPPSPKDGLYSVGRGRLAVWNLSPARICLSAELAGQYREWVREILREGGEEWKYTHHLTLRRGPYLISASMNEGNSDDSHGFQGLYADMLEHDYRVITEKSLSPDENAILFDFSRIEDEPVRVIGCSARIFSLDCDESGFSLEAKAADRIQARMRIRLPRPVGEASAWDDTGKAVPLSLEWEKTSRTVLLGYTSENYAVTIKGTFQ